MSYWSLADAAVIQAQIYREWGVAIVKGSGRVPTGLLECTVPSGRRDPFKVACEGSIVAIAWGVARPA